MSRLAARNYFDTALSILGTGDLDGLTLDALCQRLEVTKGSFYHHFKSRADFVDQLVDYWQEVHGMEIVRAARSIEDPAERLGGLRELSMALPHAAERTLRSAGSSDTRFAEAVATVDRERRGVVSDTLTELGVPADVAEELAYFSTATLIGLQQLEVADRDRVMPGTLARLQDTLVLLIRDAAHT